MLTIQFGDLATRIVRGLGVRGRVPTGLDETVVPVVMAQDLTDRLYAQNPAYVGGVVSATLIVNPWVLVWQNLTPGLIVSIDRLVLQDAQAVAVRATLQVYLLRGQAALTQGTVLNAFTTVFNQQSTVAIPAATVYSTGNPAVLPGVVPQQNFMSVSVPAAGSTIADVGVVLYPNDALIIQGPAVAGSLVTGWWQGREFQRV